MLDSLNRRAFVRTACASGAALAAGGLPRSAAAAERGGPARRPNLLFVFSDQQSYDMVACNGNPHVHTPHLDRFAGEGLNFSHCFSNAPVCTPYRGMLLSGKHPLHNGALENDFPLCPAAGPHLGSVLDDAGYRTGYIGKWHLLGGDRKRPVPAGPLRAGFDGVFLSDNCTTEYRAGHAFWYGEDGEKNVYDSWQPEGQTDQAIDFLKESAADDDEPFALFVSWHPPHDHGLMAPHPPRFYDYRHFPAEYAEPYEGREVPLRPGVEDSPLRRESTRDYYAMCTGIDACFGRLMAALEEAGLDENTLVVFTSDHGDMLGRYANQPPKRPIHDTSSRVPLLMRQPGVLPAGGTRDLLIGGLDMMPTLLGMLGLDAPGEVHGLDLSAPVRDGGDGPATAIPMLMIGWPVFRGVVTREWSYAMGPPGGQAGGKTPFNSVLFDRRRDPDQLNNLFDDPDHVSVVAHLRSETLAWMDRFEDPFVTLPDLARIQPIERFKSPPGDPSSWPMPIDLVHGRVTAG